MNKRQTELIYMPKEVSDFYPMAPDKGPPLPRFLELFWPWYMPPEVGFKVSDLIITPTEVQIGYPVSIFCLVTNTGTEAGDYTVKLGGDFVAEQVVTLAPGESMTVSFELSPTVAKVYNISLDGLTGKFTVTEGAVADIRVENLLIEPLECLVGETVTISVTATNYGGVAGTKKITCNIS